MEKKIYGIDALYYFVQSSYKHEEVFLDLLDQVENRKAFLEQIEYKYDSKDIVVKLNNIELIYNGKGADGFYWFGAPFYRLGMKSREVNVGLQNIKVQLNGMGIYTLGLMSLFDHVNKVVLKDISHSYYPISRLDLNCFVQHDFKYLTRDMLVSRKQFNTSHIVEHGNRHELESFYVGKRPFLLRVYNKMRELQAKASPAKVEMMHNHFGVNGLDLEGSIFNVEFELHREFLKQYGINTVEDALVRAKMLFENCCDLIRFVDTDSISEEQLKSKNRNRAKTLDIWTEIKEGYDLDDFNQISTPLAKIKSISQRYSLLDAEQAIKKILLKLLVNDRIPTLSFFIDVLNSSEREYAQRTNQPMEANKYLEKYKSKLKNIPREALILFKIKLEVRMQDSSKIDVTDQQLLAHQYEAVTNEIKARNIDTEIEVYDGH